MDILSPKYRGRTVCCMRPLTLSRLRHRALRSWRPTGDELLRKVKLQMQTIMQQAEEIAELKKAKQAGGAA
jgi:hypothetical protein